MNNEQDMLRSAIQRDAEYLRGLTTGWNLGLSEDAAKLESIKHNRQREIDNANQRLNSTNAKPADVCGGCESPDADRYTCDRCGGDYCDDCGPERDDDAPIDLCDACCDGEPDNPDEPADEYPTGRLCGRPGCSTVVDNNWPFVWCQTCGAFETCEHGNAPHVCNACNVNSDRAFDERRGQ